MSKIIEDSGVNRRRYHQADYMRMIRLIPNTRRGNFHHDYMDLVTAFIPLRYRRMIVHHMKRRYRELSTLTLP